MSSSNAHEVTVTIPVVPASTPSTEDLREYGLRPVLIDAAAAHRENMVVYDADGVATVCAAALERYGQAPTMTFRPDRQFPCVRATLDDLNKALSRLANSPRVEGEQSLREAFEVELERYETLAAEAYSAGAFEPDYGTYVVDHHAGNLYLIAPERWHRLALVTSNSKLLTDPDGTLSWADIRVRLEGAVMGFAGVSVGGNILEGWLREARPRVAKLADPDWVELTNFNRGERMSLRHVVGSRARRFDPRNPYDVPRVSKAQYLAYEAHLVDPYLELWVYKDGLDRTNVERFVAGDGASEPPLSVLVEEMDNLDRKIAARETARRHGVDVLMASDFGHRTDLLWNHFRDQPTSRMGRGTSDEDLLRALAATRGGDRTKFFDFAGALCGPDYAGDAFADWVAGRGEQPTGSMPQSGATAMASGALAGKELALHVLGHHRRQESPVRIVYDMLRRRVQEG
jgi:hypothetical protein